MHQRASACLLCLVIVLSSQQVEVCKMHTFPAFTELLFCACQKCKQPMAESAVSAAIEEIKGTGQFMVPSTGLG